MMVRPAPLMLPPVQFRDPVMVRLPDPMNVPEFKLAFSMLLAPLNVAVLLKFTEPTPDTPPPALNVKPLLKLSVVVAGTLIVVLLLPPPFKLSVPPVRSSVPVLLNGMPIVSVPAPVLVNVPALLKAGPPQQLFAIVPPLAVKLAPARLLNIALAELNNQELTPLIVAAPLLSSARERNVILLAVTAIVAPAAMMVRPVPLMVPPVQLRAVVMVTSPVPPRAPFERVSRAMLVAALVVAVPVLMMAVSRAVGTPAGAQLAAVNQSPLLPVQVRVV